MWNWLYNFPWKMLIPFGRCLFCWEIFAINFGELGSVLVFAENLQSGAVSCVDVLRTYQWKAIRAHEATNCVVMFVKVRNFKWNLTQSSRVFWSPDLGYETFCCRRLNSGRLIGMRRPWRRTLWSRLSLAFRSVWRSVYRLVHSTVYIDLLW